MNPEDIKKLLQEVHEGSRSPEEAYQVLRDLPYHDLGFAKIDNHRELRTGYPEVIFCAGKTADQIQQIIAVMVAEGNNVLATRATPEMFEAVKSLSNDIIYNPLSRTLSLRKTTPPLPPTYIAVVTAGTSDIPVAEEAAITAEMFGNRVERIFDVGIAGIHRLYENMSQIREARVVVVVAGMEGALPSLVAGLISHPVIAVPTSIGYGANFHGLSALLGMLTSCSAGIGVVNIDNGFGAGYLASMINRL